MNPVKTPIIQLTDATREECRLVAKRTNGTPLTREEEQALHDIYEAIDQAGGTHPDVELEAWVDAQEARIRRREFPANFHE